MAAHKSQLGELHALIATAYTKGIELDMGDDIYNPALLSAAAKFLKDNEITADIKSDDDLGALREKLKQAAEAKREAGQRILKAVGDGVEEP